MKKVYLHGELGKRFGSSFELNINSVQEALSAIEANSDGFYNYASSEHMKGNKYIILTKKPEKISGEGDLDESLLKLNNNIADKLESDELHLIPVPKGGAITTTAVFGFWSSTVGITSTFIAGALTVATYVAVAVAISFVVQALFKPPKPPAPGTKVSTKSMLMSGSRNRQAQGIPIPLGYGILKVGCVNINAKVETFDLKRNTTSNSTVLESFSETEYIDALCEGPVAGLVDKRGNILPKEDIRQGIYLNNVPIKNTPSQGGSETFNYVLNEDQKNQKGGPILKDGSELDFGALSDTCSYTIEYNTKLHGPGPYVGSSGVSVYDDFNQAITRGAYIFSHGITSSDVSQIVFEFSVTLMQMNDDPGDSLSDAMRFAIFITRNGKRINVLSPDSGISRSDIDFIKATEGATEVNSSKITRGIQIIESGSHQFFFVQGLASSAYNFSISIKYDPKILFVDNSEQLSFSVVKLNAELDPTKDQADSVAYDNPGGSNSTYIGNVGGVMRNKMLRIAYVQEMINEKLIYPNTAAVKIRFDSKNFQNIPLRSYHAKLKKILIPSNYDPESRQYSGPWDGLFKGQSDENQSIFSISDEKKYWSNNPAWVFFDLLTNCRYGLGKYGVNNLMVDKWQLYKISKYCDELVETNYPVETKTGFPLVFRTNNNIDYNSGTSAGSFTVIIDSNQYINLSGAINETSYEAEDFFRDFGKGEQFQGKKVAFFIHQHNYTDSQISGNSPETIAVRKNISRNSSLRSGEYNIEERFLIRSEVFNNGEMTLTLSGPAFDHVPSSYADGNIRKTIGACATQINHSTIEPRFACNLYLTEQSEAVNSLNSLASLFRGMVIYSAGKISVVQDSSKSSIMLFNNSNVRKKEGFSYSGFARNKKITASLVRFNNEENNYKPDVVYEEDPAAMQIYGYVEKETMGLGITSRSMARRLAKWVLASSNLESEKIQFVTGTEGAFLYPGSVFEVSDEHRSGESMSGRILDLLTKSEYLDADGNKKEKDKLSILIDKSLKNVPNIRRVEILINTGLDTETYESISERAKNERSQKDQDIDIDSVGAPQTLRFDGSIFVDEDLKEKGPQGQKTLVSDLRVKFQFYADTSTNTINIYKHGLQDGDRVRFSSLGVLPSGLDKEKKGLSSYFVVNSTLNTFQVSETSGGKEVNIIDQGRDYFLNEGGEHFVCVEDVDGSISQVTLKAFKKLELGASFSLKGLFGSSGSRGQPSTHSGVLNRVFVNQSGNPEPGKFYNSSLLGQIYNTEGNDWFFAVSFGWLYLGHMVNKENSGNNGFWFFWSEVGWVWSNSEIAKTHSFGEKKIAWFYLNDIYGGSWAAVTYEAGDPDPGRIYIYNNISGYSVGDTYLLGDKSFDVVHVSADFLGLKLREITNTNEMPTSIPSEISNHLEESSNPGYNESEILNIESSAENESRQNVNALIVKLNENHGVDLFKNRKIKIKNFNSSNQNLNNIINKEWNTIYIDVNTVELIDSSSAYDQFQGASISDSGELYFVEDVTTKASRAFESQLFRTLSVKELDNNQYEVQGIEYNSSKFNFVDKDSSVRIPLMPIPPQANMTLPESPTNLTLTDLSV